jgi:uroporphyrinogen decarboxylase
MTHRERLAAAVAHRLPDRTPTSIFARPELLRLLAERMKASSADEVIRRLGADLYLDVQPTVRSPDFERRANGVLGGDHSYAGQKMIFHDQRTFEDLWGVVRRVGEDGRYVGWVSGPLTGAAGIRDLDDHPFPRPEWICGEAELARSIADARAQGRVSRCFVENPYKVAWYLRGMENLLADYAVDPQFVEALLDRIVPFSTEFLLAAVRAGVDVVAIEGDIAMQDRVIAGPERWRAIDKPRLASIISACRRLNPEVYVFFHSDGNLTDVMDDLIEIGFQIIDSIQPECMDPVLTKQRFGARCTLHGCGSLQRVLPFGTVEDCRAEVRMLVDRCGYDGGLVLRPSNMIGFDVPPENVIAWYETTMEYAPGARR